MYMYITAPDSSPVVQRDIVLIQVKSLLLL